MVGGRGRGESGSLGWRVGAWALVLVPVVGLGAACAVVGPVDPGLSGAAAGVSDGAPGRAASEGFTYKVGDVGPGGGYIFFVDYFDQYPSFTYLEAAPADAGSTQWCNDTSNSITAVSGWTAGAVGRGQTNTTAMVGLCTSGAAKMADDYSNTPSGGSAVTDWFLPSMGEAMLMYTNLRQAGVGGFASVYYWSSSEYNADGAWAQGFSSGLQSSYVKGFSNPVRPVRAF